MTHRSARRALPAELTATLAVALAFATLGAPATTAAAPAQRTGAAAPSADTERVVAGAADREAIGLTIYNGDRAMVRETRRLALPAGVLRLELADVSAEIMPDTAVLEAEALTVLEQNFDFDLLTPRALMEKAVGQTVEIHRTHPETGEDRVEEARVLSANEGVILEIDDRIEILDRLPGRIVFAELPPDLRARPTLSMTVDSRRAGERSLDLAYLSGGLSWEADYVGVLAPDETALDLEGWITLTNRSGTDYADARIQLVAGDLNLVREERPQRREMAMAMAADTGVSREALMDYHLYTLPRRTDVADKQTKQVSFLEAPGVAVDKRYHSRHHGFSTLREPRPANVSLHLDNTGEAGLGEPLPGGIVRIYAADRSGALQFVGEDRIRHLPEGGDAELALGRAFDVQVRPTLVDRTMLRSDKEGQLYEVTQRYTLTNARDEPVTVILEQHMPGRDWALLEAGAEPDERTADTLTWYLAVPASGEAEIAFSARIES